MRYLILFLLVYLTAGFCKGQNKVHQFYSEKNRALESFAKDRDTLRLLDFYNQCLEKYEYSMLKNLSFDKREGFELAVLKERYEIADNFLKYEISTGLNRQMLSYKAKKKHFEKYLSTEGAKVVLENFNTYENLYQQGLNLPWLSTISAALETDQYARSIFANHYSWTTGNAYKRFAFLDDSLRQKLMNELIDITDSINFASVYNTINKHGFFSYTKTRGGLGFLLVHLFGPYRNQNHLGVSSNEFLDSVLLQAISEGEYPPSEYAYMVDLPDSKDNEVKYGVPIQVAWGVYEFPKNIIDIKGVDKRRSEIFLPPLWVDAVLYNLDLPEGYVKQE